jgi:hypothetical protein
MCKHTCQQLWTFSLLERTAFFVIVAGLIWWERQQARFDDNKVVNHFSVLLAAAVRIVPSLRLSLVVSFDECALVALVHMNSELSLPFSIE